MEASGAAAGEGGQTTEATTPASEAKVRPYGIYEQQVLTLDQAGIDALKARYPDTAELTILVAYGRAIEGDPKKALTAVGQSKDLDGDYTIIADSAKTVLPAKVKTERNVQIG